MQEPIREKAIIQALSENDGRCEYGNLMKKMYAPLPKNTLSFREARSLGKLDEYYKINSMRASVKCSTLNCLKRLEKKGLIIRYWDYHTIKGTCPECHKDVEFKRIINKISSVELTEEGKKYALSPVYLTQGSD